MSDRFSDFYDANYRRKVYPPAVLLIGTDTNRLEQLRQRLERQSYNVESSLNVHVDQFVSVYQKHFDLIILDVEADDVNGASDTLREHLLLLNTPIAIISATGVAEQITKGLPFPIYHIPKDSSISSMSPIIEQVHYISYRYM